MENDVSEPHHLPCVLHPDSLHQLLPGRHCGSGREWLDPNLFRVVCFGIGGSSKPATDLLPFHGFSPVLKYLHLVFTTLPSPHVFNFICSFPLLEDLCLVTTGDVFDAGGNFGGGPVVVRSSSSPPFTGMLMLSLKMGMNPITSQLLSLPMGPHFRKLRFRWYSREDALPTTTLVEKCSPTLEFLRIDTSIPGLSSWHLHSHG